MAPAIAAGDWLLVDPTDRPLAAPRLDRGLPRAGQRPARGQARRGRPRRPGRRSRTATSSSPTMRPGSSSDATPEADGRGRASASRSTRAATAPSRSSCSSVGPGSGTRRSAGSVGSAARPAAARQTRPPARRPAPTPAARQSSAKAACASAVGDQRVGKHDEPIRARSRHSRRRASTRAWPASRISSSRTYSEKRSVAGSRPSVSQRARTSAIRSAISAGRRNT